MLNIHTSPPSCICTSFGTTIITKARNIISFGRNDNGFLGHERIHETIYPPKQIPNLTNIKMVDCGYMHTAFIDFDGNLFTFGSNFNGRLGIGKDQDELLHTHIPQKVIDIPPVDFISCGLYFTICITNGRVAYSFGVNDDGQLGIGNNKNCLAPQLIENLYDIETIRCGNNHVICKTYSNEFYSWGKNDYGQLGQGNYYECNKPLKCLNWPEDIVSIKCGSNFTLLLTLFGKIFSFGTNSYGQLGFDKDLKSINIPTIITDISLIKRIECGCNHSMCIDIDDNLWVFGHNFYGQLGLGDTENRYKPILNESLHDIIDISSGGYHTFVKTINNEIYVFGYNEFSQLGIKASYYQLKPIQVFKDNEDTWGTNIFKSKQKSARK